MIIFDTDILSMFAKAKALNVLLNLLSGFRLCITPKIKEELSVPLQYGHSFPREIFNKFEVIFPTEEEYLESERLQTLYSFLGKGELEAIAMAKIRKCVFSSNDLKAFNAALKEEITVINVHIILRTILRKKILNKSDLKELIQRLETSDNARIKDVDKIFV